VADQNINPSLLPYFCSNANLNSAQLGDVELAFLPDYTDFTYLFDVYKITGVQVTWMYNHNSSENPSGVQNAGLPILTVIQDQDDGTAPTSLSAMYQYGTCKVYRLDKPVTKFFRVKQSTLVDTATGTGYAVGKNTWIDANHADANYYGFKWAVECPGQVNNNVSGTLRVAIKYYFKCKDTK